MADRTVRVVVRADAPGFAGTMAGAARSVGTLQSGANMAAAQLKGLGAVLAGGAIIGGLGAIVTAGNQFNLNAEKWGVITQATSAQMEQMRATAKALGNDMELPGSTAADAAEAMLELSKSGFSVQDSMTAARSTIVLATAAEVGIGEAAMMASDMMQQFGLSADQTARVTDVLTNAANASSISLVDVYNSMKYAGPVAKTFGISIEDAATAIAMLGNAGIKGEMGGTAMRGALASLASPSKNAKAAMDALGLSVYDQQGKFKGMRTVIEQMTAAKKNLTDQEFQAATATAFGRENLAGMLALAEQGPAAFDKVSQAVGKQGSALELAKANTKGLGGAMKQLQSQLIGAGTEIYESIAPGLEAIARGASGLISESLPGIGAGFSKAKEAASGFAPVMSLIATVLGPVVDLAGAAGSGFAGLSGPMMVAVAAVGALVAMRARVSALGATLGAVPGQLTASARAAQVVSNVAGIGTMQLGKFGTAIGMLGQRVPVIAQMQGAFLNAAVGADRFGRSAGTAAAAGVGLKAAGAGLLGVLGGPLGVALMGATIGAGLWAEANARAKQAAAEHKAQVTALSEELNANAGTLTRATAAKMAMAAADEHVQGGTTKLGDVLKEQGVGLDGLTTAYQRGSTGLQALADGMRQSQKAAEAKQQALINEGDAQSDAADKASLAAAKYGLAATALERQADTARESEAEARKLSRALSESRKGAEEAMGASDAWNNSLKVLNETTSTAEQRAKALNDAWALLSGDSLSAEQATDRFNSTMRKLAEQTEQNRTSLDGARESNTQWSASVLEAGGKLSTATKEGEDLKTSLNDLRTAALGAMDGVSSMGEKTQIMSDARERAIALGESMGLTKSAATAVADAMGLIPSEVATRLELINGTDTQRQLGEIRSEILNVPAGKDILITAPTDAVRTALEEIGFKLKEMPDGRFKVTADSSDAMDKLRTLDLTELSDKTQKLLGDDTDLKSKQQSADEWTPLDRLQTIGGDIADAVRKQAEVQGWNPDEKTQEITADDSEALAKIAGLNAAQLTALVQYLNGDDSDANMKRIGLNAQQLEALTQYMKGDDSDANQKRTGLNAQQLDTLTQMLKGDSSDAISKIQGVRGMGIADKVFNIVANISSMARQALGFAAGGIVEPSASGAARGREVHEAQFGLGTRTWAEPETGGEAYIPLSAQKRGRSKAIAEQVVQRFGGQVAWGPTVGQQAAGQGVSRAQLRDMFEGLERHLTAATARQGRAGAAVQIGAYYQQSGATAAEVAHDLMWEMRGRG
ncbi:phage tail tape measure protein (plasmid) [Streptomyces sp. BI20]|uniref:phage tail tape measure protein n=1 Tax=Streptomyces sp. BI20 TaxID=3403460 RepID=UPI003C7299F4